MQENPNLTPEQPEEESNAAKLLRIRGGAEDKIHDEKEFITEYDKKKNFWYFDVKSDGYTLDNHRRKLDAPNDLAKYEEFNQLLRTIIKRAAHK